MQSRGYTTITCENMVHQQTLTSDQEPLLEVIHNTCCAAYSIPDKWTNPDLWNLS